MEKNHLNETEMEYNRDCRLTYQTTKHTQASRTLEMLHITVMIGILSAKITVIKCVYLFLTQIIIYNERCK